MHIETFADQSWTGVTEAIVEAGEGCILIYFISEGSSDQCISGAWRRSSLIILTLAKAGLIEKLFERFGQHLEAKGYIARAANTGRTGLVLAPLSTK
jgi:hypothetical protein